jgi:hypothetical protein
VVCGLWNLECKVCGKRDDDVVLMFLSLSDKLRDVFNLECYLGLGLP